MKIKFRKILLANIVVSVTSLTFCNIGFSKTIDSILSPANKEKTAIGISIVDLESKKEVFSQNKDKLYVPASLSKLFTSVAALKILGPGFKFKTPVKYSGEKVGGIIKGDLYIIGEGDPNIVSEKLWLIANHIKLQNIQTVEGNLCFDDSYFDEASLLREAKRREQNPYNAPLSALSVNYNSASFLVYPNLIDKSVTIKEEPIDSNYIKIDNRIKLKKGDSEEIEAQRQNTNKDSETYKFFGALGEKSEPISVYRAIDRASLHAASMFKAMLKEVGITIKGDVKDCESKGKSLTMLYEYKSDELGELINLMNKFSNNFMADQLFLKIGGEKFGAPSTPEKGEKAVLEALKTIPFKNRNYQFSNGSGLTYDNEVSPSHITELLTYAYRDYSIYPELVASLARTGTASTLRKWFNGEDMGSLRAKTGSLSKNFFVAGIAGYITSDQGKPYAFAIVTNTKNNKIIPHVRDIEESLIREIKKGNVK